MSLCKRVHYLQQGDKEIKMLILILKNLEGRLKYELGLTTKFKIFDVLYRKHQENWLFVVP